MAKDPAVVERVHEDAADARLLEARLGGERFGADRPDRIAVGRADRGSDRGGADRSQLGPGGRLPGGGGEGVPPLAGRARLLPALRGPPGVELPLGGPPVGVAERSVGASCLGSWVEPDFWQIWRVGTRRTRISGYGRCCSQ